MKEYKVVRVYNPMAYTIDEKKIEAILNQHAKQGWVLVHAIREQYRLLTDNVEAVLFLERDVENRPSNKSEETIIINNSENHTATSKKSSVEDDEPNVAISSKIIEAGDPIVIVDDFQDYGLSFKKGMTGIVEKVNETDYSLRMTSKTIKGFFRIDKEHVSFDEHAKK